MKRILTATIIAAPIAAALAQPPAAPPSIFEKAVNRPGIGWQLYGDNQTAKQVAADDVPGKAAVRVQVSKAAAHPWDVGATYPTMKPIAAGDTLLVMVYLRAPNAKDAGETSIPIGASEADAPYTPFADETVRVGPAWKRYFASGIAPKAFAAGKARIALQLGGAKQMIEVGPAFLFDLGAGVNRATLPHN